MIGKAHIQGIYANATMGGGGSLEWVVEFTTVKHSSGSASPGLWDILLPIGSSRDPSTHPLDW